MRTRERLRLEVRAALIAQEVAEGSHDWNESVEELVGWMRAGDGRERGSITGSWRWHAGYLAALIWSHEDP